MCLSLRSGYEEGDGVCQLGRQAGKVVTVDRAPTPAALRSPPVVRPIATFAPHAAAASAPESGPVVGARLSAAHVTAA